MQYEKRDYHYNGQPRSLGHHVSNPAKLMNEPFQLRDYSTTYKRKFEVTVVAYCNKTHQHIPFKEIYVADSEEQVRRRAKAGRVNIISCTEILKEA